MEMPILKPIPIPTKEAGIFKRIWIWFSTTRRWEVVEGYVYNYDGDNLLIPKGFVFDGASIPRLFWAVLSPTGLLLIPGLFHDYGYRYDYLWCDGQKWNDGAGKAFWDKLFLEIGEEVNGVHFANWIAWSALKIGGWVAWNNNQSTRYFRP